MEDLRNIPVSLLVESTLPLRLVKYNSVEYAELVASVRNEGVLQPLLVRPRGDKFEVVEGGHRLAASREARRETVPCMVREMTDEEVLAVQVQANAIRPVTERAEFATRLSEIAEERKLTINQLAATIHKSVSWVRDTLSLRHLHRGCKSLLADGKLSIRAAVAISKLPQAMQADLLEALPDLSPDELLEKCRLLQKQYREQVRTGRTDMEIMRQTEPYPWYRPLHEIKREALENAACAETLKLMGAKTAQEGWRACLAWMLHLDPKSIQNLKSKLETRRHENLSALTTRQSNRAIANSLLKIKDFKHE